MFLPLTDEFLWYVTNTIVIHLYVDTKISTTCNCKQQQRILNYSFSGYRVSLLSQNYYSIKMIVEDYISIESF